MRAALFSLVALAAIGGSAVPAEARDYPYCLQGRQTGYPGDCGFDTYAQCMATASGRDAYCGINPMVAFARQRMQEPAAPGRRAYRNRSAPRHDDSW